MKDPLLIIAPLFLFAKYFAYTTIAMEMLVEILSVPTLEEQNIGNKSFGGGHLTFKFFGNYIEGSPLPTLLFFTPSHV